METKKRRSPTESATSFKVGTQLKGNDGNMWEITETKSGVQRWVRVKNESSRSRSQRIRTDDREQSGTSRKPRADDQEQHSKSSRRSEQLRESEVDKEAGDPKPRAKKFDPNKEISPSKIDLKISWVITKPVKEMTIFIDDNERIKVPKWYMESKLDIKEGDRVALLWQDGALVYSYPIRGDTRLAVYKAIERGMNSHIKFSDTDCVRRSMQKLEVSSPRKTGSD